MGTSEGCPNEGANNGSMHLIRTTDHTDRMGDTNCCEYGPDSNCEIQQASGSAQPLLRHCYVLEP